MGTRIAASDLTWLLMDRPNNLMHVHGLMTFDELPEWDALRSAIFDRVVTKYRVLSQIPVKRRGHWEWVDDPDFSIDRHVLRVVLPDSDPETLRSYVASQFSVPFDRTRPLWDMQLISGPEQDRGGAMLSRFHHGLGDGIRLVQLLLGTCDPAPDATPKKVGRSAEPGTGGPLSAVLHFAEHSIKDSIDALAHSGDLVVQAGRAVVATMNPLELPHHLETATEYLRHPTRIIDALTEFTSDDNEMSNSWREVGRLLLHEKADSGGAWSGHPDVDKGVAWTEGISLEAIKKVAATFDGTVNDTLMAAVSLALTDYLTERGVADIHDLAWMMPVSLQPVDGSLPSTLGNHFAVVLFSMPLGIADPAELIGEIRGRTTRLKHSVEPALAFGVQKVIAEAPGDVAKRITDFFSNKTIGQLSNVPGPRAELTMVGAPVRTVLGWVPTSGDQPIGVCLFTYNGTVGVGVSSDTRMVPDPDRITTLIRSHIDRLIAAAEHAEAPTPTPTPTRRRASKS